MTHASPATPAAREQIGPHELVEQLGERAGTALYRARAHTSGRHPDAVALRLAQSPEDASARRAVAREQAVLALASDPRVPQVLGQWQSRGAFAMTWIEGEDLSEIMARCGGPGGALDVATTLHLARRLAQALAHVHRLEGPDGDVVHGSIGVDAVRVGYDGRTWLLGLGRRGEPGPHARPPEQAAEAFVDHRADQWALAALILHLLRGLPLPATPSSAEVQAALQPVGTRWPALGRVLQRALAGAAGDRFPSCEELALALEEAEQRLALPAAEPGALALQARQVREREAALRAERLEAERKARAEAEALRAAQEAEEVAAREAAAEAARVAAEREAARVAAAAEAARVAAAEEAVRAAAAAAAEASARAETAPAAAAVPDPASVAEAPTGAAGSTGVTGVAVEYEESIDPSMPAPEAPTSPQAAVEEPELEPTQVVVRGASISPLDDHEAEAGVHVDEDEDEDGDEDSGDDDDLELEPTEVIPSQLTGHTPDEEPEGPRTAVARGLGPTEWAGLGLSALFFVLGLTWLAARIW